MGFIASMIRSPVIFLPSLEITAAMAHPEGMRTWPSFVMGISSFRSNQKKASIPYRQTCIRMNAFAHLQESYILSFKLSRAFAIFVIFEKEFEGCGGRILQFAD